MKKIGFLAVLSGLCLLNVAHAGTFSTSFQNGTSYQMLLTGVTNSVNSSGSATAYCSENGQGKTCYPTLGVNASQWINLDQDSAWIDLEYDVCQQLAYDSTGRPSCGGKIGHLGVSFSHQAIKLSNQTPDNGFTLQASADPTKVPYVIKANVTTTIAFGTGTNNGNNVTDNSINMFDNFFKNNNAASFVLPNTLALNQETLSSNMQAVQSAYASGGIAAANSAGWALQFGYDATRFPLWSGAYLMGTKDTDKNSALKSKLQNYLSGYVKYVRTSSQNKGVADNGYWAATIPVSGATISYGQPVVNTYTQLPPALEAPAAVAADAVNDDLYNTLIAQLNQYQLSQNTPVTSANSGDFLSTTSAYYNGSLYLMAETLIVGHGNLELKDSDATGYASYKQFSNNYTVWKDLKNSFLASTTVTDKNNNKHDALRVIFSLAQAPSTEGGDAGKAPTVSEGMGYGLLLAYAANDQATFDKMLWYVLSIARTQGCAQMSGSSCTVKTTYLMPWMIDQTGQPFHYTIGGGYLTNGSATDADIQIAWAVYLASQRVAAKQWQSSMFDGLTYAQVVSNMKKEIAQYDVNTAMTYFNTTTPGQAYTPGSQWGTAGTTLIYPGYFTPQAFEALDAVS